MKDLIVRASLTLLDVDPPIWRRLEIPASFTLKRLHDAIQCAMGWQDCHLHRFEIGGVLHGETEGEAAISDALQDEGIVNESKTRLVRLLESERRVFTYVYDFGDDWHLAVVLESADSAHPDAVYPRVIGGARCGPPEDIGGPFGYLDFLEAIADPDHERHEELTEWIGEGYDPERLDRAAINAALARLGARKAPRRRGRWVMKGAA